jgi:predicted nucleic acid-binding protein
MDAAPALIDTNIFGYVFDAKEPRKRRISRELLAKCWRGEVRYAVLVQNLAEFAVVMTEKVTHPMPEHDVQNFIRTIVSFDGWTKLSYSGSTIQKALEIRSSHSLHFWDALIVATMQEHGICCVYSEDRNLKRVPSISVINPYDTSDT